MPLVRLRPQLQAAALRIGGRDQADMLEHGITANGCLMTMQLLGVLGWARSSLTRIGLFQSALGLLTKLRLLKRPGSLQRPGLLTEASGCLDECDD